MNTKTNQCIGTSLEELLEQEGILEKVYAEALKTSVEMQGEQAEAEED